VVLAALGGVRLAPVGDEPVGTGRPDFATAGTDRRGGNAEVVEDFQRDIDVRCGFELGRQIEFDPVVGDRAGHQQRRDVLRGDIARDGNGAAVDVAADEVDRDTLNVNARTVERTVRGFYARRSFSKPSRH